MSFWSHAKHEKVPLLVQFNKSAVGEENAGGEFVWLKGVTWEKPIYRSPDSSEAEMERAAKMRWDSPQPGT